MQKPCATRRMCLIALSSTRFRELSPSFWEQACAANQHGLGLMYFADGVLTAKRWLHYDAAFLLELLRATPPDVRVAIHLREATAGERGECNLHPHTTKFDELELAVMHNGSLRRLPAKPASGPSDTALFVRKWLPRQLARRATPWHAPDNLKAIEAFAGARNRFVMLDSRGTWQVVGAQEGFDVGGTWLSNPRAKAWLPPDSAEDAQRCCA